MTGAIAAKRGIVVIKLVVSDIDGTLVDRTEKLQEPAYELVKWLKEHGILFSLASGRVQGMAEDYASALEVTVPYVTANGAALIQDGEAVERHTFPLKPLKDIIHFCDEKGLAIIYSPDGYEKVHRVTPFILEQQRDFDRYHNIQPLTEDFLENGRLEKLCLMDDDRTGIIEEIEKMCQQLPDEFQYTRYNLRAIEIVRRGCTKASGIRMLADHLKLSMDEIMCIGDDENDLEMLQEAGVGATINNALPKVKALADYVATANHAAGVYEAVLHCTQA